MITIVGVRFKKLGKVYYFDPKNLIIKEKQEVIAETARGLEFGVVQIPNKELSKNEISFELGVIIRIANKEDKIKHKENKQKEKDALPIFEKLAQKYKLDMKLVDIELTFDNNKIIFFFTAEGRVDFRELVKELASVFRMRIELRQIGVRDKAKSIGGVGICGRTLCCSTFLNEFQPVSIKMAKDQKLSLNPTKISGVCGRLMCCLKYEQDVYEEIIKDMPNEGDIIKTTLGICEVLSVNILKQTIKASIKGKNNEAPKIEFFYIDEIEIINRRKIKEDNNYSQDLKGIED